MPNCGKTSAPFAKPVTATGTGRYGRAVQVQWQGPTRGEQSMPLDRYRAEVDWSVDIPVSAGDYQLQASNRDVEHSLSVTVLPAEPVPLRLDVAYLPESDALLIVPDLLADLIDQVHRALNSAITALKAAQQRQATEQTPETDSQYRATINLSGPAKVVDALQARLKPPKTTLWRPLARRWTGTRAMAPLTATRSPGCSKVWGADFGPFCGVSVSVRGGCPLPEPLALLWPNFLVLIAVL